MRIAGWAIALWALGGAAGQAANMTVSDLTGTWLVELDGVALPRALRIDAAALEPGGGQLTGAYAKVGTELKPIKLDALQATPAGLSLRFTNAWESVIELQSEGDRLVGVLNNDEGKRYRVTVSKARLLELPNGSLTPPVAAPAEAVEDALVGNWVVTQSGEPRTRLLEIDLARQVGTNQFLFYGRFGINDGKPHGPILLQSIQASGGELTLRMINNAGSRIEVRRVAADRLDGTSTYANGTLHDASMVRVKPEEVALSKLAVTRNSKITLVYIGAGNCPYCRDWEHGILNGGRNDYLASPLSKKVVLREVHAPSFTDTSADRDWPDDLKWLRGKTYAKSGTPRFIVLLDNAVLLNARNSGWQEKVIPLLKDLVAKKDKEGA